LGAKLVEKVLLRLLCRLLPVREAWFLESTHRTSLVTFTCCLWQFLGCAPGRKNALARLAAV
jgi:hypothetical protein